MSKNGAPLQKRAGTALARPRSGRHPQVHRPVGVALPGPAGVAGRPTLTAESFRHGLISRRPAHLLGVYGPRGLRESEAQSSLGVGPNYQTFHAFTAGDGGGRRGRRGSTVLGAVEEKARDGGFDEARAPGPGRVAVGLRRRARRWRTRGVAGRAAAGIGRRDRRVPDQMSHRAAGQYDSIISGRRRPGGPRGRGAGRDARIISLAGAAGQQTRAVARTEPSGGPHGAQETQDVKENRRVALSARGRRARRGAARGLELRVLLRPAPQPSGIVSVGLQDVSIATLQRRSKPVFVSRSSAAPAGTASRRSATRWTSRRPTRAWRPRPRRSIGR